MKGIPSVAKGQGWTVKVPPGLICLVKTGLNHTEKATKVGKIKIY